MKLNPVGLVALLGGLVLLYAAVKNKRPQDVIREALGKQALGGPLTTPIVDSTGGDVSTVPATLPPASGVPLVTV